MRTDGPPAADSPRSGSIITRVREAGERGLVSVEYLAVTLGVAALIGVMVGVPLAGQNASAQGFREAICEIFGGDCSGTAPLETEEDYQAQCTMGTDSSTSGSTVDIAFINLGGSVILQRVTMSDGSVHMTILDEQTVGANFEVGKLKLGDAVNVNLGAGADYTYGNGDTWVLPNAEEADAFEQQARDAAESGWNYVPLIGTYFRPDNPENPQITYSQHNIDADVNAALGFEQIPTDDEHINPVTGEPNIDLDTGEAQAPENSVGVPGTPLNPHASASAGAGGTYTRKHDRGADLDDDSDDLVTTSWAYDFEAEAEAGAVGADATAEASTSAQVSVTTNADGEIVGLTFETVRQTGAGVLDGAGESESTVYTTHLEVTDENRHIVDDWASNPANRLPNPMSLFDPTGPTQDDGDLSDFDLLLFNQAIVTENTYHHDADEDGSVDFSAKFMGVGLGYGVVDVDSSSSLTDAYYYGMPDANGERPRVPNPNCQDEG